MTRQEAGKQAWSKLTEDERKQRASASRWTATYNKARKGIAPERRMTRQAFKTPLTVSEDVYKQMEEIEQHVQAISRLWEHTDRAGLISEYTRLAIEANALAEHMANTALSCSR